MSCECLGGKPVRTMKVTGRIFALPTDFDLRREV